MLSFLNFQCKYGGVFVCIDQCVYAQGKANLAAA